MRIYAFSLVILVITAIFNALLKGNNSFLPGEVTSMNQTPQFKSPIPPGIDSQIKQIYNSI